MGFMVVHNTTITPKASAKKAQKGHSTHVIDATSNVKIAINSQIAESLMNISSYHTLTADKNSQRYHARTKLVKIWTVMTVHSC
jgi:hypothetical protein